MADIQTVRAGASAYGLANEWQHARARLDAVEGWLDPPTIRLLTALGVGSGWRCLEVGAGGGSIANWLCDRVGPSGHVLALDLNTRFLTGLDKPNLEVRQADITVDDLPTAAFDLAHVRLMLMHLTEQGRTEALRKMVAALKPRGHLLAEEMDFTTLTPDPACDPESAALLMRLLAAHNVALTQSSFDPTYGGKLSADLKASGLVDLESEALVRSCSGGSVGAVAWRLTLEQLRDRMLAAGAASDADLTAGLALFQDPRFRFNFQVTVSAWGREPAS